MGCAVAAHVVIKHLWPVLHFKIVLKLSLGEILTRKNFGAECQAGVSKKCEYRVKSGLNQILQLILITLAKSFLIYCFTFSSYFFQFFFSFQSFYYFFIIINVFW